MYAHSLNEQKIEPIRHKVYTILRNDNDIKGLDLMNDDRLFNTLIELTKVCSYCLKKKCPGGYNCRNGAINMKYKICYDDLIYGNCMRYNCMSIHLTERGLVPYVVQKDKIEKSTPEKNNTTSDNSIEKNKSTNSRILGAWANTPKSLFTDEKIFRTNSNRNKSPNYNSIKNGNYNKLISSKNNLTRPKRSINYTPGVLLTEKFLMSRFINDKNNTYSSSDSEDSYEDTEETIEYLNRDSDTSSYEESIFVE
jgi:hypothetical protein